MPHLLGLTGNIACGKTTIGQLALACGARRYLDADAVVHDLYRPGEAIYAAVAREFGAGILAADGTIDRRALGALVFGDPAALRRLEALVHPAVGAAVTARLADLAPTDVAVVDAVKLLEGALAERCDAVWLVVCDPTEERRRLIEDRGLTTAEADARLAAQPDNAARRSRVSAVIDNSGPLTATERQVRAAWAAFMAQLGERA